MQNMLAALGMSRSYLFVNTFVYTITGQYAEYAPILLRGKLVSHNFLPWRMFLMAQTAESPIVLHRHAVLDQIIRANADSLRLIIAVGGAAQDTLSTYILSKGGECSASVTKAEDVQMVAYDSRSAGGNKREYFPVDRNGKDISKLPQDELLKHLVRKKDGELGNGLNDLRQLTSNLYSCKVRGRSNTLRGLEGIRTDIRYIQVKHPGSRSPQLEANFKQALGLVAEWQGQDGWRLEPDAGSEQPLDRGFNYHNRKVPRQDFRFGLTDLIGTGFTMGDRVDRGAALQFGPTVKDASFDRLDDAYEPSREYQFTDVPWEPTKTEYWKFDRGPDESFAKILTDVSEDALRLSSGSKLGAGGLYRGRPNSSEVLVLADQASYDDFWVGRALMGLEGQKLQAFLEGIGAGRDYTILRTVPVDNLTASDRVAHTLLKETEEWRSKAWSYLLKNRANSKTVRLILTLGEDADQAIQTLPTDGIPVVSLTAGYKAGFNRISKLPNWGRFRMEFSEDPAPIAREDIPYGMRRWVGTSGDRVIRSGDNLKIVAPDWAATQRARPLSKDEARRIQTLLDN